MTASVPASSRRDCDTRPPAALHQRPSGRSRSPRIDPSTITSPATKPSTQISPGARGTIGATRTRQPHNHSPPEPLPEAPDSDKPFRKRRCAFAEVHARATVRDELATGGQPATDEMAVFGAHP